jgi:hypothetical protein
LTAVSVKESVCIKWSKAFGKPEPKSTKEALDINLLRLSDVRALKVIFGVDFNNNK